MRQVLSLSLALNPAREMGDLPLRSFYRYAAPSAPPAPPPAALFDGLPPTKTLTLGMDVPEVRGGAQGSGFRISGL